MNRNLDPFHDLNEIREKSYFDPNYQMPKSCNILEICDQNKFRYKIIRMSLENGKSSEAIATFPAHLDMPKYHPNADLILKEFAAKLYSLGELPRGTYSLMPEYSGNMDGTYKHRPDTISYLLKRLSLLTKKPIKTINKFTLSKPQKDLFDYFCNKYNDYSFPRYSKDGSFSFEWPIQTLGIHFSFHIPVSNHELLKGLNSNFI